jgi:hypothetical protein
MRMRYMQLLILLALPMLPAKQSLAQDHRDCSGHELLAAPRAESSCATVKPEIYPSPDKALRALVLPVEADLNATPDMESRVVIRSVEGKLLTSRDYSSPRGANGYYVARAKWSPDSQFFVFSMSSSGGHSPWSFPTWVFSREKNVFVSFNKMIADNPTLSDDFSFSGPHTIAATTWEKSGSDKQVPVVVDLKDAIEKLTSSAK